MWAACFGRKSPREVRDIIYNYLCDCRVPYFTSTWAESRTTTTYTHARHVQMWVARYYSLMIYPWVIFVTVLCAPMLAANIAASELFFNNIPQSEDAHHIGVWTPYAATALILFAATVARFQDDIVDRGKKIMQEAVWRTSHIHRKLIKGWRAKRRTGLHDFEKVTRPKLDLSQRKQFYSLKPADRQEDSTVSF